MKLVALALVLAAAAVPGSAAAASYLFRAHLDQNEPTPTGSTGTGFAELLWDADAHSATLDMAFDGLIGTTTASHIHAPTALPNTGAAGVATTVPTFPGFPLTVHGGTYHLVFATNAASSYNPSFVTASGGLANAEVRLLTALRGDTAYINIHTTRNTGGEIRGFFAEAPEPAGWAMMILGFAGVGAALRRRRPVLA